MKNGSWIFRCWAAFWMTLLAVVFLLGATPAIAAPLRIATDEWPPYEYTGSDGEVTGFSTEVVRRVFKEMDIDHGEIQVLPWARGEAMVFNGELDVLFSASHSEKRLKHCHFPAEPLLESPNVLFIRAADRDRLQFEKLEDLRGRRVGIVRNYAYTSEFLDFVKTHADHTVALDDTSNFKLLMGERVDFIPADLGNGLALVDRLGLQEEIIPLRNNPIKTSGIYVMFSKKTTNPELVARFSEALKNFRKTPAYSSLYDRYFGAHRIPMEPVP